MSTEEGKKKIRLSFEYGPVQADLNGNDLTIDVSTGKNLPTIHFEGDIVQWYRDMKNMKKETSNDD
jgi:hypothetical protein